MLSFLLKPVKFVIESATVVVEWVEGKIRDEDDESSPANLEDYILQMERDPQSWGFYKRQESTDWTAEEFIFTKDAEEYRDAPDNIKRLMKGIIGFFLIGDGLISAEIVTLLNRAYEQKNWPKFYYLSMKLKIENTHAETYSKAALTIVPKEEHPEIVSMCKDLECIRNKGNWLQKYVDYSESEALENVACAVGEGVFFVSLFAIIFYMRKLGLFNTFIESNEQISKDETTHRDEACAEVKRLITIGEVEKAIEIIKTGVEIEKSHADYLLQFPILGEVSDRDAGLTKENLYKYIEKLANEVCHLCGLELIYPDKSFSLKWMEDINMSQKSNFYERENVVSYRKFDPNRKQDDEIDEGIYILDPESIDF